MSCRTDFSGISFIDFGVGKLAVGVDVEVFGADANVAGGQNQVGAVHRLDHVVQAQVARLQLERIDVDLNLPIGAAVRLRHRRALHIRNLVAHLKLRHILQLGFVQSLALRA